MIQWSYAIMVSWSYDSMLLWRTCKGRGFLALLCLWVKLFNAAPVIDSVTIGGSLRRWTRIAVKTCKMSYDVYSEPILKSDIWAVLAQKSDERMRLWGRSCKISHVFCCNAYPYYISVYLAGFIIATLATYFVTNLVPYSLNTKNVIIGQNY